MLKRLCKLPARQSCFLFGARQTGKTTLVESLLPRRSWTVDLLRHEIAIRYSSHPDQFRTEAEAKIEAGVRTIFIDEVQRVPELLNEVHHLIDKRHTRFILSGSSARKLRRGGANLLAGRAAVRHLYPLTMSEQREHFDLGKTLRFGGLPHVVTTKSPTHARDFLRTYAEVYLREEIQAEALVRNLGGFARFVEVAASRSGDILNASSVGRDAMIATRTVQEYFQILDDTLIGFRLPAWRKSPRSRLVAHPRFYLFDTGVTNALNRRLTAKLDTAQMGRLFEQFVVLECQRLLDYGEEEAGLYYWRTNTGAEVDLLVEKHGVLRLALEIKYKKRVVGTDIRGMRSFAEQHPEVPRVVVCLAPEDYELEGAKVLHFERFFRRFPQEL